MRYFIVTLLVSTILAGASHGLAQDIALDPAVPIIVVKVGNVKTTKDALELPKSVDTPVIQPLVLANQLGLLLPPPENQKQSLSTMSENAKALFFKGDHPKSKQIFEYIIQQISENPAFIAFDPTMRELIFNALIFAAWNSKELNEISAMENLFSIAGTTFSDLKPKSTDFPPWIRNEFEKIKSKNTAKFKDLKVEAPHGCEIYFDGRLLVSNTVEVSYIATLKHTLFARCFGRKMPVTLVRQSPYPQILRPLILNNMRIDGSQDILSFTAEKDITDEQITQDAASIAAFGNWSRAVVMLSRDSSFEFLLIETSTAEIVRRFELSEKEMGSSVKVMERLSQEGNTSYSLSNASEHLWYKDSLAWTFLGSGLAILGTGLALTQINEAHSFIEPFAWAMVAGGVGVAGTGIVLFFSKRDGRETNLNAAQKLQFGFAGSWHF